jgi:hypothetical protein
MASFYQLTLKANTASTLNVQGKLILVDKVEGADGVDITPVLNSSTGRTMPGRKQAFKAWIDYDTVILQAAVDCIVSLWLSNTDVSLGFADGASVNVAGGVSILNDAAHRVPVDLSGGTVTVTADNVGVNNDESKPIPVRVAPLAGLVHLAPVAVGVAVAALPVAAANAKAWRKLHMRNESADATIAVGGAGVTMANATILIGPGETWIEDDAAGAAWYAVASKATELRMMAVTA